MSSQTQLTASTWSKRLNHRSYESVTDIDTNDDNQIAAVID